MNRLLFSIIITLCSLTAQSQTFLDSLRKDEPGKGSVSVTQSPEIDNLVNGTELSADERQTTFTNMMKIALEVAVKMDKT